MKTMSATVASKEFGRFIDAAQREPVLLTKKDRPVAVTVSVADWEELTALRIERGIAAGLADIEAGRVPHVRRLRPDMAWEDVLRIVNGPLPRERQWTQSRLLRAVNTYVRYGFLPQTVLDRAGRRKSDDRLPAIVAAIKGSDAGGGRILR